MHSIGEVLDDLLAAIKGGERNIEAEIQAEKDFRKHQTLRELQRSVAYVSGRVPASCREWTLESFDETWSAASLRAGNLVATWDPKSDHTLFIAGRSGVGKTHLATGAFLRAFTPGSLWLHVPEFVERLHELEAPRALRIARLAPVVLLDDLGAEVANQRSRLWLETIICRRMLMGRPTIITTNLGAASLEGWSERVFDRLMGRGVLRVSFARNADSYRRKGPGSRSG